MGDTLLLAFSLFKSLVIKKNLISCGRFVQGGDNYLDNNFCYDVIYLPKIIIFEGFMANNFGYLQFIA